MAYALVKRLLPDGTFHEYKADLKIVILEPSGKEHSIIEFKSADNPDSIRGFGVNFFIMDEAARCDKEAWVSLLTTLTQTRGKGILISTPWGKNWFYEEYQKGVKEDDDGNPLYGPGIGSDPHTEWLSIRMPTWLNPHVPIESIEEMRRNLPEDVFTQEVGAKFLLDSAGVFRGLSRVMRGVLQPFQTGKRYILGVDLGRLKDFTVLTVMDQETRNVVYFERFNKISWPVQYRRILDTARRYRASVWMDTTGIGDPVLAAIQGAGVKVNGYKISSNVTKQQLIDKLRVNIENARISIPPKLAVMKRELEAYEYQVADNGMVKFSAPSGMHDDCVISLALANWGADTAPWRYRHLHVRGI